MANVLSKIASSTTVLTIAILVLVIVVAVITDTNLPVGNCYDPPNGCE
jgi:hypothetical protein